jgi:hypothetical protein
MSTADGIQGVMFAGTSIPVNALTNTTVGLRVDCFARVRNHSTDLFLEVMSSEAVPNQTTATAAAGPSPTNFISIQTNLSIGVRLQIPKGNGVLLIQTSPDAPHNPHAILLDPP